MPTTKQITAITDEVAADILHSAPHEVDLSPAGVDLVYKAEKAVRSTGSLAKHLSPDNEIQEMFYQAQIGSSYLTDEFSEDESVALSLEIQESLNDLLSVLRMFLKSYNFRVLVNEIIELVDDIGGHFTKSRNEKKNDELFETWLERTKKILLQVVSNAEFREAIESLMDLLESSYSFVKDKTQQESESMMKGKQHMDRAFVNAKKLMEHMAQNYSLNKVLFLLQEMYTDAKENETVREVISRSNTLIRRGLTDEQYVQNDQFKQDIRDVKQLSEESEGDDKWFDNLNLLTKELGKYLNKVASDRYLRETASSWSDFLVSAILNERGQPTFKPELILDLAQLAKLMADKIKCFDVPRIVDSNEDADYAIDNLIIDCEHLTPKNFNLNIDSHLDIVKNTEASTRAKFQMSNMQTSARNVNFWYKKKSFPTMSDSGLLDMSVDDIDIVVHLIPTGNIAKFDRVFAEIHSDVKIRDLSVKVKDSDHQALYTLFKPFFKSYARKNIEKAMEERINNAFLEIDRQVVQLYKATRNMTMLPKQEEHLPEWGSIAFDVKR